MPKKKTVLEKAEEKVEDALEEVGKVVGDIAKKVEDALSDDTKKTVKKKKTIKKTTKKKTESKAELKAKLLEKAKALAGKVEEVKEEDIKKKLKAEKGEGKETLVPIEDYLKASIHLGTKVITPDMKPFVYKRRADGLAVFNTALLDDKIREGAEYLAEFAPEDIIVVCKREAGWEAVKKFAEATGIRTFTKKYPAGILTNPKLEDFIETNLIFICDPWLDKNALKDAQKIKIPVLAVCDTNNYTNGVSQIIPGNNKSHKSLGMIFFLLTKLYTKKRKMDVKVPQVQEFIEDWDNLQPPK